MKLAMVKEVLSPAGRAACLGEVPLLLLRWEDQVTAAVDLAGAQVGLSFTGYAGPGVGTEEHPVGTVFIGLSAPGVETVLRPDSRYMRSRAQVRARSTSAGLDLVRREVLCR